MSDETTADLVEQIRAGYAQAASAAETLSLMPSTTTDDEAVRSAQVAVLPIGSFEQHGPHLPLITDTVVAAVIAQAVAQAYPVRALPPLTVSCSHEHEAWPGTVSISARTLFAMVTDIFESLKRGGIRRLVLINGHGGNYVLRNLVQEATVQEAVMALYPTTNDWTAARSASGMQTTDHQDMHAGELETSILLHVAPYLVRNSYHQADHIADSRAGLLTLGMQGYTKTGVIGRPSLATAAKGSAAISSLTKSFQGCLDLLTK